MSVNPTLYCPIRGQLTVKAKTKDGLRFSEEKRRIDCIKYLLEKGYPPTHFQTETTLIRFGHGGKNSFRTDITVYTIPVDEASKLDLAERREKIWLIAEIKRDHKDADQAKATQVKPAMNFLPNLNSIGLYWDDLEQRVFYKTIRKTQQKIVEAPLTYLPDFGCGVEVKKLRHSDLQSPSNLISLFRTIEDVLHPYLSDVSERYELLLQLLLVKIFDEEKNKLNDDFMLLQDFSLFHLPDEGILTKFNNGLQDSLNIYEKYLPKKIANTFLVPGSALREVSKHLAPVNLLDANPQVIQEFYMYFAKQLYKWDLAQYFTPYEIVDFIVTLTCPRYGDTIKDPACGSADFLISAYRQSVDRDPKIGERIFGADNSLNAVQISVLNMLLNGDGKSNISHEDSLKTVNKCLDQYSIMLCNPPFGIRIRESRPDVLHNFDLGRDKDSQQAGMLFAELVVKEAQPGGRVALIVPNGYLGNRSPRYIELRDWILRHTRVACIVGFPRFTFKKSGADVSASVLVLEKRHHPLVDPTKSKPYPVYVNLLESVGWKVGRSTAEEIYKRDPKTGALLLDKDNQPILDADFDRVLNDLYASPVIDAFTWIAHGVPHASVTDGWSVSSERITEHPDLLLDPKRLNRKYIETIEHISSREHVSLLDICNVIDEGWSGKQKSQLYRYVQLGEVHRNSFEYQELRGWELPSRARHRAAPGDIFIGSVWGSVGKWFMVGAEAKQGNLIVTNGFYRLQPKPGSEHLLPDLIFALCSEFYTVQMRALATGSDGLAEIAEDDLNLVLIPRLKDPQVRAKIEGFIDATLQGASFFRVSMQERIPDFFPKLDIPPRKTRFSQV